MRGSGSRPVSRILCRPKAAVAIHLGRALPLASCGLPGGCPEGRAGHPCLLLGLAPDGVCPAAPVTRRAGELLPHPFTLTRGVSGGLLSVALSAGRPAWDFPQRPALWSPDFPRPGVPDRGHPAGSLLTDPLSSVSRIRRAARSSAPSRGLPSTTTPTALPTAPNTSHPNEVTR